jgi:hypothetical protein
MAGRFLSHLTVALAAFAAAFALAAGLIAVDAARAQGAAPPAPLATPLTLLELMRASVEIPADGIWAIEGAEKLSEDQWLLADQDAINLTAAATLVSMGGTGAMDAQWIANGDWRGWARDLQHTGLDLRAAVKAKDQMKLNAAADHLLEVCTACHDKYRPQIPSDGVQRFPFYPARTFTP